MKGAGVEFEAKFLDINRNDMIKVFIRTWRKASPS